MRILLAVDESENSHRVVQYVGSLLGRAPDVVVTLFHVLKPMPRGLLEHGGSENPAAEAELSVQLRNDQDAWIRKERESECHVLKEACETLAQSGFDMSHVAVKYGHEDNIARNILEEARSGHYETIVVGGRGLLGSNRSSAAARQIMCCATQKALRFGWWNETVNASRIGQELAAKRTGGWYHCWSASFRVQHCVVAPASVEFLHVDLLSETG